jgi:hypothetical protein
MKQATSVITMLLLLVFLPVAPSLAGKGEGGAPTGFKDVGPAIVGTVTFTSDGQTILFAGKCKTNDVTVSIISSFNLQALTVADLEGFAITFQGASIPPELIECYPDLATNPDLQAVINTVVKFTPIPSTGPRTSVVADVVWVRRVPHVTGQNK